MPLLLGLDLGTTVFKACVFDRESGAPRAQAALKLPVSVLPGGGREQAPADILRILRLLVQRLRRALGPAWTAIEGIGIASQGGSSLIASRDGAAHTPMLLWNDRRAQKQSATVAELFPKDFWRELVLREFPPAGLARLLWLQEHFPELFTANHVHAGAGDYLYFLLTGVWRQEAGSALQIGPYNARTGQLDASPLKPLGLSLDFFPPLRVGHATEPLSKAGAALLRLPAGVPVAGPYIDQEAGYLAAAAVVEAPLQVSLGTAWVGNFRIAHKAAGSSPGQLVLPTETASDRLVVQPLLTGNSAWDWALHEFVGRAQAAALRKADALFAASPFPPGGMQAIPWQGQMNPLTPDTLGAAVFTGVGLGATREDFVRAVAFGLVSELHRTFAALCARGEIRHVALTGGASKSAHFRHLLASLFAPLPVLWQADSDLAGARGALHVFGGKTPQGRMQQVPLPDARFREEAVARHAAYLKVFDTIYGHLPAARPYTFAAPGNA